MLRVFLILGLGCDVAACGGDDDDTSGGEGEGEDDCVRDPSDSVDNAETLPDAPAEGEPNVEGFICPIGDGDYYSVTVPEASVLRVQLVLAAPVSPVNVTYNLYSAAGDAVVYSSAAVQAGVPLTEVICPDPGDYVIEVEDQVEDAFDFRNPYQLTVTAEPQPDAGESDADTPLGLDSSVDGFIACAADVDRYVLDIPADTLLEVHLTSDIATYEPTYRLLRAEGDGEVVMFENASLSGSREPTDISGLYAVPEAGEYFLEVLDTTIDLDDRRTSDADTPYALEVTGHAEPDPNDRGTRNDEAAAATVIGSKSCGGSYQGETITAYFSAIGDVDWYRVPLSGCGNGIIQVTVDASGTDGIDPQIRLVRPYPDKSCDRAEDCQSLDLSCNCDIECSGFGNTCVGVQGTPRGRCEPDDEDPTYRPGTCAGAAACLGGTCGATQVEKNAAGASVVATAQPLLDSDVVWVVVQDFRSDASDLDTPYTIRIETRQDPDGFERDHVYNPYPYRFIENWVNEDTAQQGGWSTGTAFCVTGTMATEQDEDWFYYANTCPDQQDGVDACHLEVHSDFEAGPVDYVVTIVRNNSDWFQPVAQDEAASNPAFSSVYGVDECFFAVEGDEGYYLVVQDNRGTLENPNTPDWSDTQQYTVCVQNYRVGCEAPCVWHSPPDDPGCNVN